MSASAPQGRCPHPPLRFPCQSPQSSTSATVLCSTRLRTSADRAPNIHDPRFAATLVLSPVWRPHGSHREINGRPSNSAPYLSRVRLQPEVAIPFRNLRVLRRATPTCVLSPNHPQPHTARYEQSNHPATTENCQIRRLASTHSSLPLPPQPHRSPFPHSIPMDRRPPQSRAASF